MSEQRNSAAGDGTERRFAPDEPVEFRAAMDGGKAVIRGYAAVFDRESVMLQHGGRKFVEKIARGAFDGADMTNVVARFNHGFNSMLARTPDSLRLGVDARGLWYEFDYDQEDPEHVSVRAKIKRKDIKTSSFEFRLPESGGETWDTSGDVWKRTILRYSQILDVGPVVNAAYPDTSVAARSMEAIGAADRAAMEAQENTQRSKVQAETILAVYGKRVG